MAMRALPALSLFCVPAAGDEGTTPSVMHDPSNQSVPGRHHGVWTETSMRRVMPQTLLPADLAGGPRADVSLAGGDRRAELPRGTDALEGLARQDRHAHHCRRIGGLQGDNTAYPILRASFAYIASMHAGLILFVTMAGWAAGPQPDHQREKAMDVPPAPTPDSHYHSPAASRVKWASNTLWRFHRGDVEGDAPVLFDFDDSV